MRKAETVRRLEHHAARRANISRFEIAPVLAIREIGEADALGLELDPRLDVHVRDREGAVVNDALCDRPAALAAIGLMNDVDDRARVLGALDAIAVPIAFLADLLDRKSTRLNSSH